MAVLKCKMCGGDLEVNPGQTVAECEYCGSRQTVPTLDSEKKMTLFARANRLRSACEFDKAAGIYETIVTEFPEEAESYWGLVLCKYGIEYVDDPATGKKIPTCHRSSFESVMDDGNFDMAQEYADAVARRVYREEAKQIEQLRRGIIAVSSREEPYDIFICYKETDEAGNRTLDSVLAQDIYDALTDKGYRVFFSRITLEEKLGQEYEPYIFAALNSARIMLAVGTDYDHFNAVWVKNEWSRYLKLMTQDKSRHLIPCYKGIDAYDMPKEFNKLQAQDLGKLGAMQDLLRGIGKLMPKKQEAAQSMGSSAAGSAAAPLLRRMNMFLEEQNWTEADKYAERVLDMDPECAEAYLGKLMAARKISAKSSLGEGTVSLGQDPNYKKALRFADTRLKTVLENAECKIQDQIERSRKDSIYANAVLLLRNAHLEHELRNAAAEFDRIAGYRDAVLQKEKILKKIQDMKNEEIYAQACAKVGQLRASGNPMAARLLAGEEAVELLGSILDYNNAQTMYLDCQDLLEELRAQERARKEAEEAAQKEQIYREAEEMLHTAEETKDYLGAARKFETILGYRDAGEKRDFCLKEHRNWVMLCAESSMSYANDMVYAVQKRQEYARDAIRRLEPEIPNIPEAALLLDAARQLLEKLQELEKEEALAREARRKAEEEARQKAEREAQYASMLEIAKASDSLEEMEKAKAFFESQGSYRDSKALALHCSCRVEDLKRQAAEAERARIAETIRQQERAKQEAAKRKKKQILIGSAAAAVLVLVILISTTVSNMRYEEAFNAAVALYEAGEYEQAAEQFRQWDKPEAQEYYRNCLDSMEYRDKMPRYEEAMALLESGDYEAAAAAFAELGNFQDSPAMVQQAREMEARRVAAPIIQEAAALEDSGDIIGAAMLYGSLTDIPEYMEHSYQLWNQFARRRTIATDSSTYAVTKEGRVLRTHPEKGTVQMYMLDVIAVEAAYSRVVALKSDGKVEVHGGTDYGADKWSGIVDIAVDGSFIVGLKADGTVVVASDGTHSAVSQWTNIIDIAAGCNHIYGMKADGTVVVSGYDVDGETYVGRDLIALESYFAVVPGESLPWYCTLELNADGTVSMSGSTYRSRVGDQEWKDIVAIGVGGCTAGLKKDGTVILSPHPGVSVDWSAVKGWRNIVAISVGDDFIVGLKADGTLVATGNNTAGQCNVTDWSNIRLP